VRVLVAEGTTVLLTTQYLDEADQLADRIAIIDHGRVIAQGTSAELKALVGAGALHVRMAVAEQRDEADRVLAEVLGEPVARASDPAALSVRAPDPERVAEALTELSRRGLVVAEFALGQPSLDEVFLALTGRPVEEPAAMEDAA
jgi:ABC-2 type transport system ATP-binding protein